MNQDPSRAPGHRPGWLIGIVVVIALGMLLVRSQEDLDANIRAWFVSLLVVLGLLLTLLWFLFLGRFGWRLRLSVVAVLAIVGFAARQTLRVDGTVDASGLPRLVWKWSARPEASPTEPKAAAGSSVGTSTNLSAGDRPGEAAAVPAPPGAIDTPQFLGPNRDGVLVGSRLARDWAATPPREVWRRSVGAAWSAFAVVGGRAYTQEQRGEDEWVSCYALKDGSLLWAQTNRARFFQWQGGEGPRATPTVDRGRVFAFGGTGILDCLDATTGVRLWTRSVLAEHNLPNLIWGVSASPLVFGDTVVVTGGMTNRATALAYKRETGEPLWTAGTNMASYASPVYAKVAGRPLVLSVEASGLIGYDPATGAEVLRHVWGKGDWPKASQPVVVGEDRIFLSAGYTVGCLMIRVTARPDGGMSTEELWKNKRMKTQFNSAVYRGGDLFGLDDGLLACVDAETGERLWKDGRYGAGQILVVDDLIVIQSEPGFVALAEANRAGFRELGRIAALDAKTWNYPTLAGRYLIARNDREAVCYELPVEPGTVSGR